jgi:hypothetical protein
MREISLPKEIPSEGDLFRRRCPFERRLLRKELP